MAKRGRPTKFNAQRAAIIIDYVRKGNFKETAANAASITSHTLDNWVAAGKKAKSGKFFDFFTALELADAEAEANNLSLSPSLGVVTLRPSILREDTRHTLSVTKCTCPSKSL